MECNDFYRITATPFSTRETFNNTIILLTMIKSDCYYITGFSRPDHIIEIAFDFQSDLHSSITEHITIDFDSDNEYIVVNSVLKNVSANEVYKETVLIREGTFSYNGNDVIYEYKIKKDRVLPLNFKVMHQNIITVKNEIMSFEKECFENYLS